MLLTFAAFCADNNSLIVKVTGIQDAVVLKNAQTYLDSLRRKFNPPIETSDILSFKKRAVEKVRRALQPYGYFQPTMSFSSGKVKGQWEITANVNPGQAVKISKVSVTITGAGKGTRRFDKLVAHLPVKAGHRLQTPAYNKAKDSFYDVASQFGYFDSKMLESKIIINLKTHSAQVIFKFFTGPRFRFGNTKFTYTPFRTSFLKKFLAYKRGQYYSDNKVQNSHKNLSGSDYFDTISITPEVHNTTNHEVPVRIKLITRKKRQYIFGAGFGTDTGIRGTLGIDWRWLNSLGHRLRILLVGSQRNSQFTTEYHIPGSNPAKAFYTISAGVGNINQASGKSDILKFAVLYSRQLNRHWKQVISLNYLNEHYQLENFPYVRANLIYPSILWNYITMDKPQMPNMGFRMDYRISGTPTQFGKNEDGFIQNRVDIRALLTLKPTHTRFMFRTDLGYTAIRDVSHLPLSLQLLAGGARSVRGYRFNEIGPGRTMVVGSFEIQQRIWKFIYLTGFCDAGNVADDDIFKGMHVGVGPGIAAITPVGLFELTAANAITSPNKPWVIQFTMGPSL